MKYIRKIIGPVIIFFDAITRPKPVQRSEQDQQEIDRRTKKLALYQFHACPFCVKVRRTMHRLNLKVDLKDAKTDSIGNELLKEGGKRKVPCLRIEQKGRTQWMYDSKDIIRYLESSFK
ncbi:MAG: glutathione S-transferase N-terminal domain-containing protein [Candidatus Omnitrophota bacterium]